MRQIIIISLALVACAQDAPDKSILGTWECVVDPVEPVGLDGVGEYSFSIDGTYTQTMNVTQSSFEDQPERYMVADASGVYRLIGDTLEIDVKEVSFRRRVEDGIEIPREDLNGSTNYAEISPAISFKISKLNTSSFNFSGPSAKFRCDKSRR